MTIKSNKQLLETKIKELGFELGCYHKSIETLTKKELNKVLAQLDQESTDVDVMIKKKLYVVEITTMDNEKDIQMLSREEYIDRYGMKERWYDED